FLQYNNCPMRTNLSERSSHTENPSQKVTNLRQVAELALAILENGHGIGALNEAVVSLQVAQRDFESRGLTDYAQDCSDIVDTLKKALVGYKPRAKQAAVKKLHKIVDKA